MCAELAPQLSNLIMLASQGSETLSSPFLPFRSKCSSMGYVGKGQHPRDEILGSELKGRNVSRNINGRHTKPRRREENLNGETGQGWNQEEQDCVSLVGEHNIAQRKRRQRRVEIEVCNR